MLGATRLIWKEGQLAMAVFHCHDNQAEGIRGLCAGMSVTLLVGAPSTALYFGSYELSKQLVCLFQ